MSLVEKLNSYGSVTISRIELMHELAIHLLKNEVSFRVMFDFDGSAIFFLIEPEDQK
jgi:hypothetical protein